MNDSRLTELQFSFNRLQEQTQSTTEDVKHERGRIDSIIQSFSKSISDISRDVGYVKANSETNLKWQKWILSICVSFVVSSIGLLCGLIFLLIEHNIFDDKKRYSTPNFYENSAAIIEMPIVHNQAIKSYD